VLDQFKTAIRQQGLVFASVKTRVMEGIASIRADGLAAAKAGVKHQNRGWRRMRSKHLKHPLLIFVREMKETVPGLYSAKSMAEGQASHIADDPVLIRHPRAAKRYEGGGTVDPGHVKASRNHVKCNRRAASAAKVKNSRALRKQVKEALDKGLVDPTAGATVRIP
jgi:hypothetical protein